MYERQIKIAAVEEIVKYLNKYNKAYDEEKLIKNKEKKIKKFRNKKRFKNEKVFDN